MSVIKLRVLLQIFIDRLIHHFRYAEAVGLYFFFDRTPRAKEQLGIDRNMQPTFSCALLLDIF